MMQEIHRGVYIQSQVAQVINQDFLEGHLDEGTCYEEITESYEIEEEYIYCIIHDSNNGLSTDTSFEEEKSYGSEECNSRLNQDTSFILLENKEQTKPNDTNINDHSPADICFDESMHLSDLNQNHVPQIQTNSLINNVARNLIAVGVKGRSFQCPKCEFNSSLASTISAHIKSKHPKEESHKCHKSRCRGTLPSCVRRQCMSIHLKEGIRRCPSIEYKSENDSNLWNHIGSVQGQDKASTTLNNRSKDGGVASHLGSDQILSFLCPRKSENKTKAWMKERKHTCSDCIYSTAKRSDLKKHIMTVHEKQRAYHCQICPYRAVTYGTLRRHAKAVHFKNLSLQSLNENVDKSLLKYICPHCGSAESCENSLTEHVLAQHTMEFIQNVLHNNLKKI